MTSPVPMPASFIELSARLGADPLLIQGAGGNTSIKLDGTLWVKASGKLLARAREEALFVPLPLSSVREKFLAGADDPLAGIAAAAPAGLRPSIETSLHAVLPHPVVLHVHSVATIALAVCADGQDRLADRLSGLNWAWVPYRRPGVPLTRAVVEVLGRGSADILVLGNHGLVVGGADSASAEALLREVERRLEVVPRPVPPRTAELDGLPDGYRPAEDVEWHSLALDPASMRVAIACPLYPDHVVFLGPETAVVGEGEGAAVAVERHHRRHGQVPPFVILPGKALLVRTDLSAAASSMLGCLVDVARRVDPSAPLRSLTVEEIGALLNWDAEAYRRRLSQ